MPYLFTSESVSEGHPDKIADQISDTLLDNFLAFDPESRVACETLVTTGQVILAGEVRSNTYLDLQDITRKVINKIGYTKGEYNFSGDSCGIISLIHEQSDDISQGVDRGEKEKQGAGDQGMMFGYATNETENYMPLALDISHKILIELARLRRESKEITYLRPDSKSQVTIEYSDDNVPQRIDTIVISTQHDDFDEEEKMLRQIERDIKEILIPRVKEKFPDYVQKLFTDKIKFFINPTGKCVIGGPHGDTGLTGRKIIVDTYGGKGAHGGGAFSGKDPSKVDRSAAYAARHIAKNMVAAGVADEMLIQVSYAIGEVEPTSLLVETYGSKKVDMSHDQIAKKIREIFGLTPAEIENNLQLRKPIYRETSAYGHFGRQPRVERKVFKSPYNGEVTHEVKLFTWEELDKVAEIRKVFNLG